MPPRERQAGRSAQTAVPGQYGTSRRRASGQARQPGETRSSIPKRISQYWLSARLGGRDRGLCRHNVRVDAVAVDELLEFRVQEVGAELVLLHLFECLVSGPAVLGHPIRRRHHARAMPASDAMNVDGLIRRIVDELQELR